MFAKCFKSVLFILSYFYISSILGTVSASEDLGNYVGCYRERSVNARLMHEEYKQFKETLTPQLCIQHCKTKGFAYAGLQYAFECFCSTERLEPRYSAEEEECNSICEGDSKQKCGGSYRLSLYEINESTKNPVEKNYIGCVKDTEEKRLLVGKSMYSENVTPEMCVSFCYRNGYRFAAVQVRDCYCGDDFDENSIVKDDEECKMRCKNNNFICGSPLRSSVYTTGITGNSEKGYLLGCFKDGPSRILSGFRMVFNEKNTPKLCFNVCYESGFRYAGVEYGFECYCGNLSPLNSSTAPEVDCGLPCPGDKNKSCGGSYRILIFSTRDKHERTKRSTTNDCIQSITEINHKKVCRDEVIFKENFDTDISSDKWTYEIKMPWTPDYEFVILNNKRENVFVKNGKLFIQPTLLEDNLVREGQMELDKCSGEPYSEECLRRATGFNIIPPVKSGKITTKETFSFKYGKIQIRAKLPRGDWIVPEIWLEPKRKMYGPSFASGRIRIAMARGNINLAVDGKECGNRKLESGVIAGINDFVRARTVVNEINDGWYKHFHNYILTWTPDNLKFSVDNGTAESLITPGKTLLELMGFDENLASRWVSGSSIAPFDQEFYISIGVSVGGMREFPDNSVSGKTPKPWKNMAVKAMLNFWQDRENWSKTWEQYKSALQIEHVRVTAI